MRQKKGHQTKRNLRIYLNAKSPKKQPKELWTQKVAIEQIVLIIRFMMKLRLSKTL